MMANLDNKSTWLEITKYLKKQDWLHKFYSVEGGWAYLSKRDGSRLRIDNNWTLEDATHLINSIKQTYEN